MLSDREKFCALLFNGPTLRADAIVVLAGEDADERGNIAMELFRQGAAPLIVCAGGVDDEPRRMSGERLAGLLMARGVAPDRLIVENGSKHTGEQARNVIEMARANEWKRLLLVASPYHMPRAFLTFVRAMNGEPLLRLVPAAAVHLKWWDAPPGMETLRADLLEQEFAKCEQYAADVATWPEGIAYLRWWEGK